MAPRNAGVAKALALHGDKLPVVALLVQSEFQNAEGVVVVDLPVLAMGCEI